jgi:hypothetical protein
MQVKKPFQYLAAPVLQHLHVDLFEPFDVPETQEHINTPHLDFFF